MGAKFGTHLFPETWIIDKRGVIRQIINRNSMPFSNDTEKNFGGLTIWENGTRIRSSNLIPAEPM